MRKELVKSILIFGSGVSLGLGSYAIPTNVEAPLYCMIAGFIILLVAGMASQWKETGTIGWVLATPKNLKKLHQGKMASKEFDISLFGASLSFGAILGVPVFTT